MSVKTSPLRRAAKRRAPEPRWDPPAWGAIFMRDSDRQFFSVTGIYRRDRQVRLESCGSALGERLYVGADELARAWSPVS